MHQQGKLTKGSVLLSQTILLNWSRIEYASRERIIAWIWKSVTTERTNERTNIHMYWVALCATNDRKYIVFFNSLCLWWTAATPSSRVIWSDPRDCLQWLLVARLRDIICFQIWYLKNRWQPYIFNGRVKSPPKPQVSTDPLSKYKTDHPTSLTTTLVR